jgi:non-ribosomal peptide synthetase component F
VHRLGVALERLLHADAERREVERLLDPLLRHHLEPRVAVAVLAADRLELTERLADRVALRVVAAVVLVEAAGPRDRVERGIRDEAVDRARDQQLLAPLHHRPVHAARRIFGRDDA